MICAEVSVGLHLPTEPTIREVFRAGVALGLQLPRKRTEQLGLLDRFKRFLKSQVRNNAKVPAERLVREFPEQPASLPEQWKIGYEKEPAAGVMLEAKRMTPENTVSLRSSDKHAQNEKAEVEKPVTTGGTSMENAMLLMTEMFQVLKNKENPSYNLTMAKPRARRPLMLQDGAEPDTPAASPEAAPAASPPAASPPAASPPASSPPATSPAASPPATAPTAGMQLPTMEVEEDGEDEEDAAAADAAYRAAKMKRPAAAAKLPGAAVAQKPKLPDGVAPGAEATGRAQKPKVPKGVAPGAATGQSTASWPAKMETGDPTVFHKGGKIRNEKQHVSEFLCLKKTNVTKRSRGRHAAKMLLGRKHANSWRTSDWHCRSGEKR